MTRIVSSRYGISLPDPVLRDEAPDIAADLKRLSDGLEQSAMYGQGTLANRPVSTGGSPGKQGRFYESTDETPHILYYDYGTGWDEIGPIRDAGLAGRKLAWNEGAAPPGSGTLDNDIWLVRADINGKLWHFRKNQSAVLYKWEFIGGTPLFAEVATSSTFSDFAAYTDSATIGPSLTVFRDGEYEIEFGFTGIVNAAAAIAAAPKLGAAATSDNEACYVGTSGTQPDSASRKIIRTLTNGDLIKLQYKRVGAAGGAPSVQNRWLSLRPIRTI